MAAMEVEAVAVAKVVVVVNEHRGGVQKMKLACMFAVAVLVC